MSSLSITYIYVFSTAVLFNVDQWRLIIIHHMNTVLNLWQISSKWCEILDSLHHHTELQLHQKILGQPLIKWFMSYQSSDNELTTICSWVFNGLLVYIVSTYSFLLSGKVNFYWKVTLITIVRTHHFLFSGNIHLYFQIF